VLGGQRAHGGQAVTNPQRAGFDCVANVMGKLFVKGER
jgi:hypothetical protein